jgi:DNA-binding MarR family transcriptional regulator
VRKAVEEGAPAESPQVALVIQGSEDGCRTRLDELIAKVLDDDRRRTLVSLGIDGATLNLVSVIRRAGPPYELTTREIARRTLITPGAVSQRVARAEESGLIERAPSPASRRAVAVRLTDAGHALINATVRPLLDHEADLIAVLTGDERAVLAKLERTLIGPMEPSGRDDEHGQGDI